MMDPSYNFEFSNEDSERSESNDINGVLKGSYSYKTPGGQDILVKYSAGAETGFVIENMMRSMLLLKDQLLNQLLLKPSHILGKQQRLSLRDLELMPTWLWRAIIDLGTRSLTRRSNRRLMLKV